MEDLFRMDMTLPQINAISNLGLAHIGDGVYELLCRSHLCAQGYKTVDELHRRTVALVKAPTQARLAWAIVPHLDEQERAWFRRGKNAHVHAVPKGATPAQYAKATGLEALFGALYLSGRTDRLSRLFQIMMEENDGI